MEKQLVWARDPAECFVLGRIHELMADGVEIIPLDPKLRRRTCAMEEVFPAGEPDTDVDDNCECVRQTDP